MVVLVQLEREEEVTGPVIAPLFPQVWPGARRAFRAAGWGRRPVLRKMGTVPNAACLLFGRNVRRAGGW